MSSLSQDLVIKESTTHKGCYYVHNAKTGRSRWLGKNFLMSLFGRKKNSVAAFDTNANTEQKPQPQPPHQVAQRPSSKASQRSGESKTSAVPAVVTSFTSVAAAAGAAANVTSKGASTPTNTTTPTTNALAAALAPVNRRNSVIAAEPGHFVSKYAADFASFGMVERVTAIRPKVEPKEYVPFTAVSTNQELHGPKEYCYFRRQKPMEEAKEAHPFQATTTNQSSYQQHAEYKPPKPIVPPSCSLRPGAFVAVESPAAGAGVGLENIEISDVIPQQQQGGGGNAVNVTPAAMARKAVKRRGIW